MARCQAHECTKRASLAVVAFGEGAFQGVFCDRDAGLIVYKRARMIRNRSLNVVVRPISAIDLKPRRLGKVKSK